MKRLQTILLTCFISFLPALAQHEGQNIEGGLAKDGYGLWLNYEYVENDALREHYLSYFTDVRTPGSSETIQVIKDELSTAFKGLFNTTLPVGNSSTASNHLELKLVNEKDRTYNSFESLEQEGYSIVSDDKRRVLTIEAPTEAGLLYGTFHLLRLLQNREPIANLHITEEPAVHLRMLNQWDNLNGTVERGYSGQSIYKWDELPNGDVSRYHDFARANASIGINAISINNVNTDPNILRPSYLTKVKKLADIFRPYNIKIFLAANFASPMPPSDTPHTFKKWGGIGNLDKSDPLDKEVINWWSDKIDEIYREIPDFGGFIVKANSEGMPGPHDYGRSHADGANMFARLLKPHGGAVIWRAFVYSHLRDDDRVKQAYQEFLPLDGAFEDNVLVQVKNGPLDFQPSEPPSPLFGAMKHTSLMPELQITQEYLGHSTYLVYLGPMWRKFFEFDTFAPDKKHSTIAGLVQDKGQKLTGIAGVANVGDDRNWTGHHFAQANWYLFGRLAWKPESNVEEIALDWIKMTWSHDEETVQSIAAIMNHSLDNFIDLQAPFGLPVTVDRAVHYHPAFSIRNGLYWQANANGIGYDRSENGSDFVSQYFSPNKELFNEIVTCPEEYLLFFHFMEWDKEYNGKETFYDQVVRINRESVQKMEADARSWEQLQVRLGGQRHREVSQRMEKQLSDARVFHERFISFLDDIIQDK